MNESAGAEAVSHGIHEHLERFFPGQRVDTFVWTLGPIRKSLPDLRVLRIRPEESGPWVYSTIGLWKATESERCGIECFLLAREPDAIHVETLSMVSNFHADPRFRLHAGKTLDIGRPWVDGASCDHLLVSLPFPFGPAFENCTSAGVHVRFLWLLPITRPEADFARSSGVAALEERFEKAGIDAVDPHRKAVV